MKKFLTLSTIALVALSMGIGAKAAPQETRAALERTVQRDQKHIRQLQHRRAYLHRYIRHLRAPSPYAAPVRASTTRSAPTSSYTGGVLSDAQAASYLRGASFPEGVISTMVAIGHRESGLCPTAVYGYGCAGSGHAYSGGPACGWLQLFPCPGPQALNPATNAALAFQKYQASGLSPWS